MLSKTNRLQQWQNVCSADTSCCKAAVKHTPGANAAQVPAGRLEPPVRAGRSMNTHQRSKLVQGVGEMERVGWRGWKGVERGGVGEWGRKEGGLGFKGDRNGGCSACWISTPFLGLIYLPGAMWTCASNWADAGSSYPIATSGAYPGARGQVSWGGWICG